MSSDDRSVVLSAAFRLITFGLRRGIPRLSVLEERRGARGICDPSRAARIAHLVRRTAECLPVATTCLDRAVVLISLLDDASLQSALRIGVRAITAERLDAHAWVQHGGAALLVHEERSYVCFDTSLKVERS
jgi:hypothetical protein